MKYLSCTILLIFIAAISLAQTAESLKERIQEHYTAIHANDTDEIVSHHLPDFSFFWREWSCIIGTWVWRNI